MLGPLRTAVTQNVSACSSNRLLLLLRLLRLLLLRLLRLRLLRLRLLLLLLHMNR